MVWRSYPFSRHNAGERNSYARRSVQPRWRSFTSQLFAEVASEMIAVIGEEVVRRSLELLRDFFNHVLNFMLGAEGEALEYFATECTSRWLRVRLCPVYPRHSRSIMATECIFPVQALYDNTSMEERATEEPEGGRECTWLCPGFSAYRLNRQEVRRTGSRS